MPTASQFQSVIANSSATIANGESLSGAVDLGGTSLVGIVMPASWTAANLTLQGSVDGVTYANIYSDGGVEKTLTAAASRHIIVTPSELAGVRYIKIRSGTAASPVNQGAERAITLVTRAL